MKKNRSNIVFILSLLLISALWEAWGTQLETLLHIPLTPGRLELLWNFNRPVVVMAVIMILLIAIAVISFLKMLRGGNTVRQKPRPRQRVKTPPQKEIGKETADEALHCEHLSGRQKYLEQIEGYLRTGLIDREEYKALRARYLKLDIPDDYH